MSQYQVGDLVRVTGEFRDITNILHDPDVVGFRIRKPDGTTVSYAINQIGGGDWGGDIGNIFRTGVGQFYVDINANSSGQWVIRYYSTGDGQAAVEDSFVVDKSVF